MSNQSPPNWAPNAIPTVHGWVDPKTGELLVSKKGLTNTVSGYGKNRRPLSQPIKEPLSNNAVTLEIETPDTLVENMFVELEIESVTQEVTEPEIKRRRSGGLKKKV
jgi:hypothetical protein